MSTNTGKEEARGIFIVIPAYNEGGLINLVVESIKKSGWRNIVVVDDGSIDGTYKKITDPNIFVLKHPINCGKGAAVKTGFDVAMSLGAHVIVVMDADAQHNPSNIRNLVEIIQEGFDVALGVRKFDSRKMPYLKIIANRIANFATFLRYGIRVSDSQCGFRAFGAEALRLIKIDAYQYDFESFMIGEIKKFNLKYREVLVDTIYTAYSEGKGSRQNFINGLKTFYRIFSR